MWIEYIVIDAVTLNPLFRIGTLKGTLIHIHADTSIQWSDTTYEMIEPDVLASTEFLQHGPQNAIAEVFLPFLKWTPQGIIVSCDYGVETKSGYIVPTRHPAFVLLTAGPLLLTKMSGPPTIPKPVHNDPFGVLRLFEYIFYRLFSFIATDKRSNQDVLRPRDEAMAIYKQYLSANGRTFSTRSISNLVHQARECTTFWRCKTLVTEVFTPSFPFATPGSTISFSGLPGQWKQLNNREFVNAVSVLHYANVPNPSPLHIHVPTRTSKIVWHFDSSNLKDLENLENIMVHVRHRVHANMEYPEFIAAVMACQYDVFEVSQHTGLQCLYHT